METENLSTLKIHKLTQKQYDREAAAGRIDQNALYLTPDSSANDWRFLGRFDVEEEITVFQIAEDLNGAPLNLKKVMIQGLIAPNTAGNSGYVKTWINTRCPEFYIVNGSAMGDGVFGHTFRQTLEVRDKQLFCEQALVSPNATSLYNVLQNPSFGSSTFVDYAIKRINIELINEIWIRGWQENVIGAGSYFELWGVDA